MKRNAIFGIALIAVVLSTAACGNGDDTAGEANGGTTTTSVSETTLTTSEPDDSAPDNNPLGAGNATVTFEEDGSTLEFVLDECFTSNTAPGNFVNVGPEGAFSSHGVREVGWELSLSVIPDANGEMVNFSFLTDGSETDYELGNLTFEVDGATVTASATSNIYQTLDTEEEIPLSFDVACNG